MQKDLLFPSPSRACESCCVALRPAHDLFLDIAGQNIGDYTVLTTEWRVSSGWARSNQSFFNVVKKSNDDLAVRFHVERWTRLPAQHPLFSS